MIVFLLVFHEGSLAEARILAHEVDHCGLAGAVDATERDNGTFLVICVSLHRYTQTTVPSLRLIRLDSFIM